MQPRGRPRQPLRCVGWPALSPFDAPRRLPQVSAPLGFSGTDPLVVLHAPCFAAISKYQPCAVLRSADGGHTWTAVNVTAPGGEEGERAKAGLIAEQILLDGAYSPGAPQLGGPRHAPEAEASAAEAERRAAEGERSTAFRVSGGP